MDVFLAYVEWLFAPQCWAILGGLAAVAYGCGWVTLGRIGGAASLAALVTSGVSLASLAVGARRGSFADGRLVLETASVVVALVVALVLHNRWRPGALFAVARPNPPILGMGAAWVFIVAAAAWWDCIPATLRPSLSLALEVAAGSGVEDPRFLKFESLNDYFSPAFLRVIALSLHQAELVSRSPGNTGAIVAVLRRASPDGRPSLAGVEALIAMLQSNERPVATEELRRWLTWEVADKSLRSDAAVALGPHESAQLAARTWADPAWRDKRSELAMEASLSSDPRDLPAFRAILRSGRGNAAEARLPFLVLLRSDTVEDRAAVLDFFLDPERFRGASPPTIADAALRDAMRWLVSDTLEDDDPHARARACAYVVGDEPQALRWRPDLWNEVQGYPCKRLESRDERAQVAASIRRWLGLPAARPPLAKDARLRALTHPEREPAGACHPDRFEKHCGDVFAIALSPDGAQAATSGESDNDPMDVWDLSTERRVRQVLAASGHGVAFGGDGPTWLAWSPAYGASSWDSETGDNLHKVPPCARPSASPGTTNPGATSRQAVRGSLGAGAATRDGSVIMTGGQGMCLWNGRDGKLLQRIEVCSPDEPVIPVAAAFAPDGSVLVAACAHDIEWFSTRTGARLGRIQAAGHTFIGPLAIVDAGHDLQWVVGESESQGGGSKVLVRLWSAATRGSRWTIYLGDQVRYGRFGSSLSFSWGQAPPVAVSPGGDRVAIGGTGLCVWQTSDGQRIQCLERPEETDVTAVAWAADGSIIVAAEQEPIGLILTPSKKQWKDRGIHIWDAATMTERRRPD